MSKKTVLILSVIYLTAYDSFLLASNLSYKPGELIVRFAPKADGKHRTLAERNEVLAPIDGGSIKHSYKITPSLSLVKLPPGVTVADAVSKFSQEQCILYAEPNYKIKLFLTPSDPCFPYLWGLHNTGQTDGTTDADIDAPEAWDIITDVNTMIDPNGDNKDIIIAVIDSGIDCNHPDLEANLWVNEAELNREFS